MTATALAPNSTTMRVARFLAQGLKPTQVASIVGCTPARISQIVKEPGFEEVLAAEQERYGLTDEEVAQEQQLNNKYLALEHKLIDSIESQAALMEPRDQIKALDIVAARQEKRAHRLAMLKMPAQNSHIQQNIINIAIPSHALPEYAVNAQSEIIAIDNKPMAPLGAAGVKEMFTAMRKNKLEAIDPQALPAQQASAGPQMNAPAAPLSDF